MKPRSVASIFFLLFVGGPRGFTWTSGDGRSVRVEVLETRAVAAQTELDFGQQIATVFDQPSQEAVAVDAVAFGGGRCTPSKKKQKTNEFPKIQKNKTKQNDSPEACSWMEPLVIDRSSAWNVL